MSRLAIVGAVALAACTASHQPAPDAGREPVIECRYPERDCSYSPYERCCEDPETGDRYCCDSDHEIVQDDGTVVYMCGDGPPCIDRYCCADIAERYPGSIERCTRERVRCMILGGP